MDNFRDSYFQINWDLGKKRLNNSVWGKQYDTGRGLAITLISNGVVVTPSTEIIRLKWEKPDGTAGYVNSTIVSGKFIIENIDQMFTVAGMVKADLELQVAGEFVASVTFFVTVDKAIAVGAIQSSSEFTALQAELLKVEQAIAGATVDTEVILARGVKPSLGARLNEADTQVSGIVQTVEKVTNTSSRMFQKPRYNRYNVATSQEDMVVVKTTGAISPSVSFRASDYVEVTPGEHLVAFGIYTYDTFRDSMFRYAFYNENKVFLNGGENPNNFLITYSKLLVPSGARYIRFCYQKSLTSVFLTDAVTCPALPRWPVAYTPYTPSAISPASDWYGKKWLTYGDSITHFGFGDGLINGWQRVANEYHGFAKHYCRGVGGSAVSNSVGTFWSFTDGRYAVRGVSSTTVANRAVLDGMTTSTGLYFATAEATYYYRSATSDLWETVTEHKLSFCRWDRIKAMIPDDIRNALDLVVVMGGTNDYPGNVALGNVTWSALNTTDAEWIADATYGNGGDYDISTFKGAMASTIMKLQKWCPNAVIVVASQLSGYGTSKNIAVNTLSLTPEDYANASLDVSHKMSCPSIDVFGTTGINQINATTYISDGTHPDNRAGMIALGRAVTAGLKRIVPRFS